MDFGILLMDIIKIFLIPVITLLTTYLVKYIDSKCQELAARTKSESAKRYIMMVSQTIQSCVQATNQTYVDALKEQDRFDANAQKVAFDKTLNSVMGLLNDEAKKYIEQNYKDVESYIINEIEAAVNSNK